MFCMPTRQLQQQNGSVSVLAVSARQLVRFFRRCRPSTLSRRSVSKPMGHDSVCGVPFGKLVRVKHCYAPSLSARVFFFE